MSSDGQVADPEVETAVEGLARWRRRESLELIVTDGALQELARRGVKDDDGRPAHVRDVNPPVRADRDLAGADLFLLPGEFRECPRQFFAGFRLESFPYCPV